MTPMDNETAIAIVGMAGRFPGAPTIEDLWRNLLDGVEAMRPFTDEELTEAGVPLSVARRPEYVAAGAPLEDADAFDAEFFGIPAHEARLMDPQQRVFLECVWAALEDAGRVPSRAEGRIGVFASTSISSYLINVLARAGEAAPGDVNYPVVLGNDKDFLATRVSYKLGLTGPSMSVQTACSSSLVAVHTACQALLAGECDAALAGGVSITFPQTSGYLYREGGIMSPDGHCRVFDAQAAGTIKGNGCAVVVLRRLDAALEDGDHIHAVIRGTAINNDGSDKVGFTAPGPAGQSEVICDALDLAGVPAADIGYMEAHGTGTALGDPIEVHALAAAHAEGGAPPERCFLGSLKANLGHLDAAAGVTGLIKAALVLREQTIPGQPTFSRPNPALGLDRLGYVVPQRTQPADRPLRAAAVSSFGIGGTNAHAVLAPAPQDARGDRGPAQGAYRVLLSAADDDGLRESARRLRARVATDPGLRLDDVALTLAHGRTPLAVRTGFAAASMAELIEGLDAFLGGGDQAEADPVVGAWIAGDVDAIDRVGDLTQAQRVPLPAYPFRRTRHWVDAPQAPPSREAQESAPLDGDALDRAIAVITSQLGAEIDPDQDLLDLGVDSMMLVEVVTSLREEFGVALPFSEIEGLRTARDLAERIGQLAAPAEATVVAHPAKGPSPSRDPRFRRVLNKVRSGDGERNVFLIHPSGGTTFCYAEMARRLQGDHTIYSIGFPFEAADELRGIRDMARAYVGLVRDVQPSGPYVLGGYSMGGNVAFEMALMLEAAGETVERVIMFDSLAPESYLACDEDEAALVDSFVSLLRRMFPDLRMPADTERRGVRDVLAALSGASLSAATLDELERFFDVWRLNVSALTRWYPDARMRADVLMLAAAERQGYEPTERLGVRVIPHEAWKRHMSGELTIVTTPGDHFSLFHDRANVEALAARYDDLVQSLPAVRDESGLTVPAEAA
jgi:3-oxoacyl-(acyl-carrier-protein) synthase/thioesterase domain-containing protein/acyl carrier protein